MWETVPASPFLQGAGNVTETRVQSPRVQSDCTVPVALEATCLGTTPTGAPASWSTIFGRGSITKVGIGGGPFPGRIRYGTWDRHGLLRQVSGLIGT